MDFDEDAPKVVKAVSVGDTLDDLSVEELVLRIEALQSEIARTEAEIVNKKSTKTAADSVFKL